MSVISPHRIASAPSIAGGMLVWLCVMFPVMGWASDVVGSRDRVMLWGGTVMAALSFVLFMQVRVLVMCSVALLINYPDK